MQALGNVLPQVRRVFPLLRNALPLVGGVFPLLRNVLPQVRSVFPPLRNAFPHVRYAPANWADDSAHATINSHIAAFNSRVAHDNCGAISIHCVMALIDSWVADKQK